MVRWRSGSTTSTLVTLGAHTRKSTVWPSISSAPTGSRRLKVIELDGLVTVRAVVMQMRWFDAQTSPDLDRSGLRRPPTRCRQRLGRQRRDRHANVPTPGIVHRRAEKENQSAAVVPCDVAP